MNIIASHLLARGELGVGTAHIRSTSWVWHTRCGRLEAASDKSILGRNGSGSNAGYDDGQSEDSNGKFHFSNLSWVSIDGR